MKLKDELKQKEHECKFLTNILQRAKIIKKQTSSVSSWAASENECGGHLDVLSIEDKSLKLRQSINQNTNGINSKRSINFYHDFQSSQHLNIFSLKLLLSTLSNKTSLNG
jgi:hypothetical protein